MSEPTGPAATTTWRTLWNETSELLGDRQHARWICETASTLSGQWTTTSVDASSVIVVDVSVVVVVVSVMAVTVEVVEVVVGQ